MWDLIVSIADHCLSFTFQYDLCHFLTSYLSLITCPCHLSMYPIYVPLYNVDGKILRGSWAV